MPTYRFSLDGHKFSSDHMLTAEEAQKVKDTLAPPTSKMSASDPVSQMEGVDLRKGSAQALRIGVPIAGGIVGASLGPAGSAYGAGLGGALGETLAERIEGRKEPSVPEVLAQGAISAVAPGPGKTVLGGAVKSGFHGLGSVTLDWWAKGNKGLPPVGEMALGTIFGGTLGVGFTKIHLRSNLREVLPTDVADEAHSVLTTGKISTRDPNVDPEEVKSLDYTRKLTLGRMSADVKRVTRGAKGRFQSSIVREPVEAPSFENLRTGGHTEEELAQMSYSRQRSIKPSGMTSFFKWAVPQQRLFDRIQRQTGIPVYDEVYDRIKNVREGDYESLKEATRAIRSKYLQKESPYSDQIKNAVRTHVEVAEHAHDGTFDDMVHGIQQFGKRIPLFRKEINEDSARKLAGIIITGSQAGVLGGRVGPPIRVLSHILQTGYMQLGERWLPQGIAKSLTKAGWREAMADGLLEGHVDPNDMKELGLAGTWVDKMQHYAFMGIRGAANLSRVIMYQGQKMRTWDAIRKSGGSVEKFIQKSNIDLSLPNAEMNKIVEHFKAGRFEEAAKTAAIARADSSVPLHGRTERPSMSTTSTGGRFATGLSTWPMFYGNLLYETFAAGNGSAGKKALAFGRWALANTILAKAIAEPIYHSIAGYDPKKAQERALAFTFLSPVFYEGSAGIDAVQHIVRGGKKAEISTLEGNKKGVMIGVNEMGRGAKLQVPYAYAIEDLIAMGRKLVKTTGDR